MILEMNLKFNYDDYHMLDSPVSADNLQPAVVGKDAKPTFIQKIFHKPKPGENATPIEPLPPIEKLLKIPERGQLVLDKSPATKEKKLENFNEEPYIKFVKSTLQSAWKIDHDPSGVPQDWQNSEYKAVLKTFERSLAKLQTKIEDPTKIDDTIVASFLNELGGNGVLLGQAMMELRGSLLAKKFGLEWEETQTGRSERDKPKTIGGRTAEIGVEGKRMLDGKERDIPIKSVDGPMLGRLFRDLVSNDQMINFQDKLLDLIGSDKPTPTNLKELAADIFDRKIFKDENARREFMKSIDDLKSQDFKKWFAKKAGDANIYPWNKVRNAKLKLHINPDESQPFSEVEERVLEVTELDSLNMNRDLDIDFVFDEYSEITDARQSLYLGVGGKLENFEPNLGELEHNKQIAIFLNESTDTAGNGINAGLRVRDLSETGIWAQINGAIEKIRENETKKAQAEIKELAKTEASAGDQHKLDNRLKQLQEEAKKPASRERIRNKAKLEEEIKQIKAELEKMELKNDQTTAKQKTLRAIDEAHEALKTQSEVLNADNPGKNIDLELWAGDENKVGSVLNLEKKIAEETAKKVKKVRLKKQKDNKIAEIKDDYNSRRAMTYDENGNPRYEGLTEEVAKERLKKIEAQDTTQLENEIDDIQDKIDTLTKDVDYRKSIVSNEANNKLLTALSTAEHVNNELDVKIAKLRDAEIRAIRVKYASKVKANPDDIDYVDYLATQVDEKEKAFAAYETTDPDNKQDQEAVLVMKVMREEKSRAERANRATQWQRQLDDGVAEEVLNIYLPDENFKPLVAGITEETKQIFRIVFGEHVFSPSNDAEEAISESIKPLLSPKYASVIENLMANRTLGSIDDKVVEDVVQKLYERVLQVR